MSNSHKTSIGGQALYEGVMMRGPKNYAVSVRTSDGIVTTTHENTSIKDKYPIFKMPLLRGLLSFFESLSLGYKTLSYSFELAEFEEEEPSKFELWLEKKLGDNFTKVVISFGAILGFVLAMFLFMYLPSLLVSFVADFVPSWSRSLLEGIVKIGIFVAYLAAVSKMPDIRRTFEYHGAEHKTIYAYENGLDLTVENVKKQSRLHPRCGTSFLLIVLVVSVLFSSLPIVPVDNVLLRAIVKIILLPFVVGVSYEVIRFAGRHDNAFTRMISAPGMWLQNITTAEPDDAQIEVAIASMLPVLTDNKEDDKW